MAFAQQGVVVFQDVGGAGDVGRFAFNFQIVIEKMGVDTQSGLENRIFSSRVPKRLSTPRLIRTLDFVKWLLDTSKQGKKGDRIYRLQGKGSKL